MLTPGNMSSLNKWLLQRFFQSIGRPPVRFTLGEGPAVSVSHGDPIGTVFIPDRETLVKMILTPEFAFGEGYQEGRIRTQGDLVAILEAVYHAMAEVQHDSKCTRLIARLQEWMHPNSLRGSRHNIHRHYDLRNDFYKLWLDEQLVYTCAYFADPSATLEEAQIAKMEHVCRKLCLKPGEMVVEAGCGWGSLALYMARNYGVSVKAFNISREQIHHARERARNEGLHGRVEFIEDDYRNISVACDVFVSVGMLEHVGRKNYAEFGRVMHRSLSVSGRGLLHFIGRNRPRPFDAWTNKYIFPGAYAPAIGEAMQILEPWDSSVLDAENLGLHYARTIEHWLERFELSADRIAEMFDERFVRMWRLYLAGSIAGFKTGSMQLFQILFARPGCRQMPWTRDHLYQKDTRTQRPAKGEEEWIPAMS